MKLIGHFAVFNTWAPINSRREGRFLEKIAPGALRRSITEGRSNIRVMLEHGQDPTVGLKPLGVVEDLREDARGAAYAVDLFDTSYVRELLPALEAGQYGASFRFEVQREEFVQFPGRSTHNPDGLAERTITEANVHEFGPVCFPAYSTASAYVRSLAALEPLGVGRQEHLTADLGSGPTPLTVRRLKAAAKAGSSEAAHLLRALARGDSVELRWEGDEKTAGGHGFRSGHVLSGGTASIPLRGSRRSNRLPSSSSAPRWHLGPPPRRAWALPVGLRPRSRIRSRPRQGREGCRPAARLQDAQARPRGVPRRARRERVPALPEGRSDPADAPGERP